MAKLSSKLKFYGIRYLLNRGKHEDVISSSGIQSGEYDAYWIFVDEVIGQEELVAKAKEFGQEPPVLAEGAYLTRSHTLLSENGVVVRRERQADPDAFNHEGFKLTPDFLDGKHIQIRHFFKKMELSFEGVFWPVFLRTTLLLHFLYAVNSISLRLERKRFKSVNDHRKVLLAIVDLRRRGFSNVSSFSLARELYGPGYGPQVDPDFAFELRNLNDILDSFVELGVMAKKTNTYDSKASSVTTAMEWNLKMEQERRELWDRRLMLLLTLVLAVASSVAAVITYIK